MSTVCLITDHVLKACREVGLHNHKFSTSILDAGKLWNLHNGHFTLWQKAPGTHRTHDAEWAPEPVWTLWGREKSPASAENVTTIPP
jgi:hypothetical protein